MLKQEVEGYLEPYLTHISPSKFLKKLEMGNFRADGAYKGVRGECTVFECHGLR